MDKVNDYVKDRRSERGSERGNERGSERDSERGCERGSEQHSELMLLICNVSPVLCFTLIMSLFYIPPLLCPMCYFPFLCLSFVPYPNVCHTVVSLLTYSSVCIPFETPLSHKQRNWN